MDWTPRLRGRGVYSPAGASARSGISLHRFRLPLPDFADMRIIKETANEEGPALDLATMQARS